MEQEKEENPYGYVKIEFTYIADGLRIAVVEYEKVTAATVSEHAQHKTLYAGNFKNSPMKAVKRLIGEGKPDQVVFELVELERKERDGEA